MPASERPVSQPCSGLSSSAQQVVFISWLVDLAAGRSLWDLPTLPCVHTQFYKVSMFLSWRQSNIQQVTWKRDSVVYQDTWGTVPILNILLHCQMLFQGLQIHDMWFRAYRYTISSWRADFSILLLAHETFSQWCFFAIQEPWFSFCPWWPPGPLQLSCSVYP